MRKSCLWPLRKKIKETLPQNHSNYQFAQKALQTTSYLQDRRFHIFGSAEIQGLKANFFHPTTIDLMTNNGACGSYVTVLSRILKSNNIKIRIGQMKANGYFGSHMIVEAFIDGRWVVMDPTYTLYFLNADSSWATFQQLNHNWDFYKIQAPTNFKPEYQFEDIRYTNWNKIPVMGPAIKGLIDLTFGREVANSISVRPYLLRNYHKLTWLTILIWLLFSLHTIRIWKQNKYERTKS